MFRQPRLFIQIPCLNEEETLPGTLKDLPRQLPGVGRIEWLVIDDGSDDRTGEVAREHGVDHVVRLPNNRGLAHAFMVGIDACLERGADIIVNTDADNQYDARDIAGLIRPIIEGRAEMVIGARPITEIESFSPIKKLLQRFGSWTVRRASSTSVPDAPSGFRAFSKSAAMRLHVFNEHTYTLETIIQAGQKSMAVETVPVRTHAPTRPSRLIRSTPSYIRRSATTILRIFMTYRPFRFFAVPGALLWTVGLSLGLRFLYYYWTGDGAGHVQSVILAALLLGAGGALVVIGLLADLIGVNRKLLEEVDYRVRKVEGMLTEQAGAEREPSGRRERASR